MRRLACLVLLAAPALALATGTAAETDDRWLDFALSFGKTKTRFDYTGGAPVDTTVEFIRVSWYERFAPGFEIGLYGGPAFLTQTQHAATAGVEPDGYHAGVAIRGTFLRTAWVQPFAQATYAYQRVTHEDNDRSVTLSWYEPQFRLGVATVPLGRLRVYGGATWGSIDGRERSGGTTPATTDFERDARGGGFIGLDLTVETDGYIGVEAHSGTSHGVEIYFKKRF